MLFVSGVFGVAQMTAVYYGRLGLARLLAFLQLASGCVGILVPFASAIY
jgi:hypothetical protein